jgi:hypothetical protein
MPAFTTWQDARGAAIQRANDWSVPQGIEYSSYDNRWVVRCIPSKDKRFGADLQCEVVEVGDQI